MKVIVKWYRLNKQIYTQLRLSDLYRVKPECINTPLFCPHEFNKKVNHLCLAPNGGKKAKHVARGISAQIRQYIKYSALLTVS